MKLLNTTIVFILLLSFSVLAQNKKTERETDGLKGSVNSVITKIANLKKTSGKPIESARKSKEAITYDTNGNLLTLKEYDAAGSLFDSIIYSHIDGDKVSTFEEIDNPNKFKEVISVPSDNQNKSSDTTYHYKYTYKHDNNGNVTEEALYQNDGSLWLKYVYKIKGNQKEKLVYSEDGSLNQKYVYTLDDKGNEIEKFSYDTEKNKLESKETFEYLEFDAKGNWTKRITSEGNKKSKFVVKPREVLYRTITYFLS